jgi:hypothetical protein
MKAEVKTLIKRLLGQRQPQDQYLSGLPREARDLFETIRSRNLTYLSASKIARLSRICDIVRHINDRTVFIEAGCALGGSAIFLAKRKPSASVLRVYDVFEMIPPPLRKGWEGCARKVSDHKKWQISWTRRRPILRLSKQPLRNGNSSL